MWLPHSFTINQHQIKSRNYYWSWNEVQIENVSTYNFWVTLQQGNDAKSHNWFFFKGAQNPLRRKRVLWFISKEQQKALSWGVENCALAFPTWATFSGAASVPEICKMVGYSQQPWGWIKARHWKAQPDPCPTAESEAWPTFEDWKEPGAPWTWPWAMQPLSRAGWGQRELLQQGYFAFLLLTLPLKCVVPTAVPALHCVGKLIASEMFQEISFPAD